MNISTGGGTLVHEMVHTADGGELSALPIVVQ